MNNEPVAYVDKIWIDRPDLVMSQQLDIGRLFMRSGKEIKNYIPLYTHPVKEQDESFDRTASHMAGEYVSYKEELTDEEIEDECRKAWGLHDQDQLNLEEVFKFARAILRKAQEK